ncbi:MAG: hypothetical protein Tsb002_22090 [Wenzhouxiangellaceae bacterium]
MIQKVRQLEAELISEALDTAHIGICVFNNDGLIVMANREFANKLDLSPAQLLNQTHTAFSAHDLVINNMRDLVDINGDEVAVEGRYRNASGHLSILLFQGRSMTAYDGMKYRVVSVVDITSFGITRDRYIELRRQLDALNSAIVIVDPNQNDMPIIHANRRFYEMTGYSQDETIGKNCRFLQNQETDQEGVKKLAKAISLQQSCHALIQNYKKDGTPFLNELFISPVFDKAGKLELYVGIQQEVCSRTAPISGNTR